MKVVDIKAARQKLPNHKEGATNLYCTCLASQCLCPLRLLWRQTSLWNWCIVTKNRTGITCAVFFCVYVLIQKQLSSKSNFSIIIVWKNTKYESEGVTAWVSDTGSNLFRRLENWHLWGSYLPVSPGKWLLPNCLYSPWPRCGLWTLTAEVPKSTL